jgi:hypothetical protein
MMFYVYITIIMVVININDDHNGSNIYIEHI